MGGTISARRAVALCRTRTIDGRSVRPATFETAAACEAPCIPEVGADPVIIATAVVDGAVFVGTARAVGVGGAIDVVSGPRHGGLLLKPRTYM